ncbi:MAG: Hsp20/alpha crystallin family protein [Candidatus Methanoperedens sp.]
MEKRTEFEEFIRQLEEAVDGIMEEIDVPEDRPVNINISINVFPVMMPGSGKISAIQVRKTPVDIIETEKNVHAAIRIPDMEMETIKIADSGRVVEITALSGDNAINEMIELPAKVNKTFKTTYNNGILEVVFSKPKKVRKSVK